MNAYNSEVRYTFFCHSTTAYVKTGWFIHIYIYVCVCVSAYNIPPDWNFHCMNTFTQRNMIYYSDFQRTTKKPKSTHTGSKISNFDAWGILIIFK